MNIITKFEHLMNSLLYWLGAKFQTLWHKVFPSKLKMLLLSKMQVFKSKMESIWSQIKSKALSSFHFLKGNASKAKSVNYKKISSHTLNKGKVALKTPPQKWLLKLKTFFLPLTKWLLSKFSHTKPEKIVLSVFIFSIMALGTMGVYFNSKRIYVSTHSQGRMPSSIESGVKKKKPYYNLDKKMVKVDNIKIPALIQDVNSISNITIDFNLISENRFISLYIDNHREEIKDYIIMRFQPIESGFVIKEEGKEIIKERIRVLIDNYLTVKGIEGSIDDVNIEYIIGT